MPISWSQVNQVLGDSMEDLVANRDLRDFHNILMQIGRQQQDQRQFEEGNQRMREDASSRHALAQAQQQATQAYREQTDREQAARARQQQLTSMRSGLKAGDVMPGEQALDLQAAGLVGTGEFSEDPAGQYVFRKQEAEKAALDAKQKMEREAAEEKRRIAADKRAEQASARAEKADARAQQRLDMAAKAKDKAVNSVPAHLRPGIKAEYERLKKEQSGGMFGGILSAFGGDDEAQVNDAQLWVQAAQNVATAAANAGQMPQGATAPQVPPPTGAKPAGPQTLADIQKMFPGATIRQVK